MSTLGTHCILELYGCKPALLDDPQFIERSLREAASRTGSELLGDIHHRFEPQGVTAVGLLAESHLSIHTWPEAGYAAVDIFTCGSSCDPRAACTYLEQVLFARESELRIIERGNRAKLPGLKA